MSGSLGADTFGDDDFARLGLPRRAALTAEEVRAAFQKAAAASHPDHAADPAEKEARTAEFTALNEASARLSAAPSRLKRLLALEYPDWSSGEGGRAAVLMDEALVALFTEVGAAVRGAAQWAARQRAASTFLAKAALTGEEMLAREGLEAAGGTLRGALESQQEVLARLDERRAAGENVAGELSTLSQRAAFLEKWQAQLQGAWAGMFGAG